MIQETTMNIVIRVMPSAEEFDVELPPTSKGCEIIEECLNAGIAPRNNNMGETFVYDLVIKSSNVRIPNDKTLFEIGVKNGDIILFIPNLVAGGFGGNMIYSVTQKLKIGKKGECRVRIAKIPFKKHLLSQGFNEVDKISEIEINNLMIVQLEENSIHEHIKILKLNTEEQIISNNYFSEWVFDLIPVRIGFSSILLRISMPEILEGFGEKRKDVFLLNKEIQITTSEEKKEQDYIGNIKSIYTWTEEMKKEIYDYISKNETGLAFAQLINFFQKQNIEILNKLIILQSQWNEGRNRSLLNLISYNEWMMIQTKVNYGILELLRNIENERINYEINSPALSKINNEIQSLLA